MRPKFFDDGDGAIGAELDAEMDVEVLLPGYRRHLPAAPDLPAQVLDVGDHQFVQAEFRIGPHTVSRGPGGGGGKACQKHPKKGENGIGFYHSLTLNRQNGHGHRPGSR